MQDKTLYFYNLSYNGYQDSFLDSIDTTNAGSKFFMGLAKKFRPIRFVARNGQWSLPWKQEVIPKFKMPEYDPCFKLSFAEVTDIEAQKIKQRIAEGEKFAVAYSGGIDSNVIVASFIKNMTTEELKSVSLYASANSIIENPIFWEQFIHNKFNIIDSNKFKLDDLIEQSLTPIIADEGDSIFGTMMGISLYNNYDYMLEGLTTETKANLIRIKSKVSSNEVHFSQYKDLIIKHLALPNDIEFGRLLYEKIVHNINTSTVPVHSLHDFFWWMIFNLKYTNCAVRCALYFNDRVSFKYTINNLVNWYNAENYQYWSMVNNNNGLKIGDTIFSYKNAAKDYIWELDKNDWYRDYKLKIESLPFIVGRQSLTSSRDIILPSARIAMDSNYTMYSVDDASTRDFFKNKIEKYKIDW
jgi:hypothetical protein